GIVESPIASVPQTPAAPPAESVSSALWRPLAMTTSAPPVSPSAHAVAEQVQPQRPESETVPSLLRPLYVTNPVPRGRDAGDLSAAPQNLAEAFTDTRLGHQLTMLDDEDLRSATTVAMTPTPQPAWDGSITMQWPLMTNPFLLSEMSDPGPNANNDNLR